MTTKKISTSDIGKKVKIKSSGNNQVKTGTVLTISSVNIQNNSILLKESNNWQWYDNELELMLLTKEDVDDLILNKQKDIELINSQIDELKFIKQFMTENDITEYDENQYKVYKTLETLENKDLSPIDKAKIIAKLIEK